MECGGAVGEEDESWGRDGGLGHVEDADALRVGDASAFEVDVLEEAVHLAGGDALTALAGDEFDGVEDFGRVIAGFRRCEDDGRVIEELEVPARLFFEDVFFRGGLAVGAVDGDGVPLINDDDDGATGVVGV